MLIKHKNLLLAAGLEWESYDTAAEAKAFVKEHAKENGKSPYLLAPHHSRFVLGMYSKGPVKNGAYAAGALLGLVHENLIIFQELDPKEVGADDEESNGEPLAWLCVIEGGKPFSGYDRVLSLNKAKELFTEATASASGTYVGNMPGARYTLDEILEQVSQKIDTNQITKKALREAQMLKPGISIKTVATSVCLAAIPVVAVLGWQGYQAQLRAAEGRELSLKQLTMTQEAARQEELKRQQRITEFQKSVAARRELFQIPFGLAQDQWDACETVRKALPISKYGYRPSQLSCDFEKGQATISWTASTTTKAVNYADKAKLPGIQDADRFTNTAITQIPMEVIRTDREGAPPLFSDLKHLQNSLFSAMGPRSRNFQLDPAAPVTMTAAPDLKQPPVVIGDEGKWRDTTAGQSISVQAAGLARVLANWPVRLQLVRWSEVSSPSRSVYLEGVYAHTSN